MSKVTPYFRACLLNAIRRGAAGPEDELIERRWPNEAVHVRNAVGAMLEGSQSDYTSREFFGLVKEKSVIGRLPLRRVQFFTRTIKMTSGANAYWVGQGNPIPLSKSAVTGATLEPKSLGALVAATKESAAAQNFVIEAGLQDDIVSALALAIDQGFLDATNTGSSTTPAAVTVGVDTVVATGDPVADLKALIEAFDGDLSVARFVTDPTTATQLAMVTGSGGFLFPDCGPLGGALLGIPMITSRASPRTSGGGQIALIDGSGIAFGYEGINLKVNQEATLEMADDPNGPAEHVSLFQTDTVAWMANTTVNWRLDRQSAVAVMTGCLYG